MKEMLLIMALGQGLDMATTHVALNRGCIELNPILAGHSLPTMYAIKAGGAFTIGWAATRASKRGRGKSAKILLGIAAGAGFAAAAWNLHLIPQC